MTVQRIKLAEMTAARLQALQTQYAGRSMDVEVVIAESGSDAVEADSMNETIFWQIIAALAALLAHDDHRFGGGQTGV